MQEHELPTAAEILSNAEDQIVAAYRALDAAADWLRSDWRPLGSSLTAEQAAARLAMREAITEAKTAINRTPFRTRL